MAADFHKEWPFAITPPMIEGSGRKAPTLSQFVDIKMIVAHIVASGGDRRFRSEGSPEQFLDFRLKWSHYVGRKNISVRDYNGSDSEFLVETRLHRQFLLQNGILCFVSVAQKRKEMRRSCIL